MQPSKQKIAALCQCALGVLPLTILGLPKTEGFAATANWGGRTVDALYTDRRCEWRPKQEV
jgi:hypothetical protein